MLIDRLWRGQPGKYFCISTKTASKKWMDNFFIEREFKKIPAFLEDHKHSDIYFCPHGFNTKDRIKASAVLPNMLWADLDEVDPSTCKIKPTIAIESSPGRYVGLWITDKPVSEDLNRRLTYYIGADKGGWDITQVLRMPGTMNHKYDSKPRVKIKWTDGPSYKVDELEERIPAPRKKLNGHAAGLDAVELFKKYQKLFSPWCRRELLNGRPSHGKRSEVLWKLEQELIEKGLSTEEALILLKASPWNKFRGRQNEDEQLRRELDKAIDNHMVNGHDHKFMNGDEGGPRLIFKPMDEVEEENIDWIWYPYLARGELTILEGDPGLGKSYLAQMVSSGLCDGKKLPCVKKFLPTTGSVLYCDIENSSGTVTKKRLVLNGTKHLERFIQCEEPFSIEDEECMDELCTFIEKVKPVLVVFDTINTYLGKADAFKGHEAQQTYARFREIAHRYHCAVMTLRHLTKSSKERALYRGQGNIAFAGLARVIITVGVMPEEEETRVMAVTKINVARIPKALSFNIHELPDTLKEKDRSKFEWGDFVELTSDEIIISKPGGKNNDKEVAIKFLSDQLDEGPVNEDKIRRMADARSIGKRAINQAILELGITKKDGLWSMPDQAASTLSH